MRMQTNLKGLVNTICGSHTIVALYIHAVRTRVIGLAPSLSIPLVGGPTTHTSNLPDITITVNSFN